MPETVISSIYGAAVGQHDWSDPLNALADHFDLWCLQLIGFDARGAGYHFSHEGGQRDSHVAALDYVREYHVRNPRMSHAFGAKPGQWIQDRKIFSPDFIAKDRFFQDFLIPHGGCYMAGMTLTVSDTESVGMAAIRPAGASPLDDEAIEAMQPVVHHLRDALKLRTHLRSSVARLGLAAELLQHFDLPMLLMDDSRCILFGNPAAQTLLAGEDAWLDRDGYLATRFDRSNARLKQLVESLALHVPASATDTGTRAMAVPARDGARVVAFLSPIRPSEVLKAFGPLPLVLVVLYDARCPRRLDPFYVREAFGMTPPEARVCVDLVEGRSLQEIAGRRQVALATIRTQLQSALSKAGVHRQSELVSLLGRIPQIDPEQ